MVMDAAAAYKTKMMEEKDGPSRAMLRSILLSVLHVWDLWASRHDLLVIAESGGITGQEGGGSVRSKNMIWKSNPPS